MKKSKVILGFKYGRDFSIKERISIIEEYLSTGCKKQEIWKKYTGQDVEHGQLLKWIRQLGYEDVAKKTFSYISNKNALMAKSKTQYSDEVFQLKEKIKELEKTLVNSELRSNAYQTMIEIAEKELKISIQKKSFTKQSTK
jgi:hypothetical protein